MPDTVSVLLPVHAGVEPDHLAAALDSVLAQTRPADEVVVVEDGPLPEPHLAVLADLETRHPQVVRVALPTNQGAGVANGTGLQRCTGTWVAKVDADDLLRPDRFERQLAAIAERGLDVCGTAMLEFDGDPENATALRVMPAEHDAILRRMRANNPVNHPTATYRRELAVTVGGYPDMRFMQDYVLLARLAAAGARFGNLDEPLVLFRAGGALHRRRADPRLTALERRLQRELVGLGLVSRPRALVNLGLRLGYRRLPAPLMRWAHGRLLAAPAAPASPAAEAPPRRRVTGEVLRRQLGMGLRSLGVLLRHPSWARELPRLVATRGRSTMALRLPWLPFRLVDELADVVGRGSRVFEYGGGGSSLWFLDQGAEVVTVEHEPGWADALAAGISDDAWTLLRRSADHDYAAYVAAIGEYPDDHFDVVVVDGRERVRCLFAAMAKVRPGGLLLLDDTDRERYRPALTGCPWPQRQVVGFAPAKPTLAYTTVFRKPEA